MFKLPPPSLLSPLSPSTHTLTLNTSASPLECIDVGLSARGALQLVLKQVGVVRGSNEVGGEGLGHVLVDLPVVHVEDVTLRTEHEPSEPVQAHLVL